MDTKEAIKRLRAFVDDLGSQKATAKHFGISESYLSDVLNQHRDPEQVLRRIGLRRVVSYEEIKQ